MTKTSTLKIPVFSIFDYMNALLEVVQHWIDVKLLPSLSSTCEKVLEFTFLQRDEIYRRYFWMETGRWDRSPQEE